jgi:hypothetical protein
MTTPYATALPAAKLPGPPLPPEPLALPAGRPPGPPPPEPLALPAGRPPGPPLPPEPVASLPSVTMLPRPGPVEMPRGFFEPARPASASDPSRWPSPGNSAELTHSAGPANSAESADVAIPGNSSETARRTSVTGSVEPPEFEPPRELPPSAAAKLDQIKDLYLTAEAIGAEALDKHFEQVSARQRELIREFFDRSSGH